LKLTCFLQDLLFISLCDFSMPLCIYLSIICGPRFFLQLIALLSIWLLASCILVSYGILYFFLMSQILSCLSLAHKLLSVSRYRNPYNMVRKIKYYMCTYYLLSCFVILFLSFLTLLLLFVCI
jgi:hypothetical protein